MLMFPMFGRRPVTAVDNSVRLFPLRDVIGMAATANESLWLKYEFTPHHINHFKVQIHRDHGMGGVDVHLTKSRKRFIPQL